MDYRYQISSVNHQEQPKPDFWPRLRVFAALFNCPAFPYQVPVCHCAPSLPKTSPAAQREDSSHLAEVWAAMHAVDGGNPPGMQRAEGDLDV